MRPLLRLVLLIAVCVVVSLAATRALEPSSSDASPLPRGIVAEQPAEGPYVKVANGYMVPYTETLPGSDVTFEMIPVPGGEFTFGSAEDDPNRTDGELPEVRVSLPPFWIARYEVTWSEYWQFMELNDDYANLQALKSLASSDDPKLEKVASAARRLFEDNHRLAKAVESAPTHVDGVTAPTPLYDPNTTYMSGKEARLPAVSMTPYAARQYTKWLSRVIGVDYRLPTEAEWEYAARAGTSSPYLTGDSPDELDQHAWFADNSDGSTHEVGKKKPNAWGLYDMLGNAAEWVIDDFAAELPTPGDQPLSWQQAVRWPTEATGRTLRGGHMESEASECRVTARIASEDHDWKASDPNFPLSPWWYTDYPAMGVGFRVVRPLEPLTPELAKRFWEIDHEEIAQDVQTRIDGGRAKLGPVNRQLPEIQRELTSPQVREILSNRAQ